jgi:hypothetical protein
MHPPDPSPRGARIRGTPFLVLSFAACTAATPAVTEQVVADAAAPDAPPLVVFDAAVVADVAAMPRKITAAEVVAKLTTCNEVSQGRYKSDASAAVANYKVCRANQVIHFVADMDIDCDGKETAVCNRTTDGSFLPQTAATDSQGQPLDSSVVPYVVVPGVSAVFSYKAAGIAMGSLAVVVYRDKIAFGVVGDIGPQAILGEASYAMAKELGVNPNPSTGGTSNDVTYLIFTGTDNVTNKIEDTAATATRVEAALRAWLDAPP